MMMSLVRPRGHESWTGKIVCPISADALDPLHVRCFSLFVHADVTGALGGERGPVPAGPAVLKPEASQPGHQVQFGRPDVAVGGGVPDQASAGLHPVMGPGDLAGRVVERLDPYMVRVEGEDAALPVGRDRARLGHDLASLDLNEIHKLVRTDGASPAAIARRLGTTSDAIQALLLDHPAPADPASGARRRRTRYIISREQLWDLHHRQRLSFTEIGQRTGYSRTAISDLARAYEIPTSIYRDGKPLKAPAAQG